MSQGQDQRWQQQLQQQLQQLQRQPDFESPGPSQGEQVDNHVSQDGHDYYSPALKQKIDDIEQRLLVLEKCWHRYEKQQPPSPEYYSACESSPIPVSPEDTTYPGSPDSQAPSATAENHSAREGNSYTSGAVQRQLFTGCGTPSSPGGSLTPEQRRPEMDSAVSAAASIRATALPGSTTNEQDNRTTPHPRAQKPLKNPYRSKTSRKDTEATGTTTTTPAALDVLTPSTGRRSYGNERIPDKGSTANYPGLPRQLPRTISNDDNIDAELFLPLLVQYGLRQTNNRETQRLVRNLYRRHHQEAGSSSSTILPFLPKACDVLSQDASIQAHFSWNRLYQAELSSQGLYWTADLELGRLVLQMPQLAYSRRIYRKFGVDRFLSVSVPKDTSQTTLMELFVGEGIAKGCKHLLFGRTYRYLWCQKDKDPQQYVLFATEGPGLKTISISQVLDWCIPQALNPDLTVAKRLKRMKLVFSKTTPTARLPNGSVTVLPDVEQGKSFSEIDGCGLVSREALELIWNSYHTNNNDALPSETKSFFPKKCPYSGFQGRLGGFKGTWTLDNALGPGVVVHCRTSQQKFHLPQLCLQTPYTEATNSLVGTDDFYDIMELCSWDKAPPPASLNIRLIQLLEHHGATWEFFKQHCLDPELESVSSLWSSSSCGGGNQKAWVKLLKEKQANGCLKESTDSRWCFKMECANVPDSDPEKRRYKSKLAANMFQSLRDKAHYSLSDCCYLRMYADHTFLLKQGEAFVAHNDLDPFATEILASRSPSYFAGDLRRLKLVSVNDLRDRAEQCRGTPDLPSLLQRDSREKLDFFRNLRNCVVLSNMGDRSEADRMSGGDYDGDCAWVCWNPELLQHLETSISAEPVDGICDVPSDLGKHNAWQTNSNSQTVEIQYALESRYHSETLGTLSERLDAAIDQFGFESFEAREFGRASFLQVDVPDKGYFEEGALSKVAKDLGVPDWKLKGGTATAKTRCSEKIPGQLYRCLKEKINEMTNGIHESGEEYTPDIRVTAICDRFSSDSGYSEIRQNAANAIQKYLTEKGNNLPNQSQVILRKSDPGGIDRYLKWKEGYFEQKRKGLFSDGNCLLEVRREVVAAILYMEGIQQEKLWRENRKKSSSGVSFPNSGGPMEFVWGVADEELRLIFASTERNALIVDRGIEPVLMMRK